MRVALVFAASFLGGCLLWIGSAVLLRHFAGLTWTESVTLLLFLEVVGGNAAKMASQTSL